MQGVPVPPGPVVSFTEARPDGDGEAETPVNGLETSGGVLCSLSSMYSSRQ